MASNPRVLAKYLIETHGDASFRKLIEMFKNGESGTKIGVIFGVTRQRVSQWKASLGTEKVFYSAHADIQDLIDTPTIRRRGTTVV